MILKQLSFSNTLGDNIVTVTNNVLAKTLDIYNLMSLVLAQFLKIFVVMSFSLLQGYW